MSKEKTSFTISDAHGNSVETDAEELAEISQIIKRKGPIQGRSKILTFEHILTEEEIKEISERQNELIGKNIELEAEKDRTNRALKSQIDINEKEIIDLYEKFKRGSVEKTELIEAEYDWKNNKEIFRHPEQSIILEEGPIPSEVKQGKLLD